MIRASFPRCYGLPPPGNSSLLRATPPGNSSLLRATPTSSKEQVVKETSSRSDEPVDNSPKNKRETHRKRGLTPPAKHKTKTFPIGKELKKKDLRQTAVDRASEPPTKTQPSDSLRREASQAASAAPTLRYGPAPPTLRYDSAPPLRLRHSAPLLMAKSRHRDLRRSRAMCVRDQSGCPTHRRARPGEAWEASTTLELSRTEKT